MIEISDNWGFTKSRGILHINTPLPKPWATPPLSLFSKFRSLSGRELCKTKIVAAYLLALLGRNTSPTADDLKNILGSVGAEANDDKIELLLSEVQGRDITELIGSGRERLASVPSGGAAIAVAAPANVAAAAPEEAAAEPKKEEVDDGEESDMDMFSLFD